jgi:hypothetical protein
VDSSRRLLMSTDLQPDESAQSIAVRLAPLCLTSVDEFLRYGLGLVTGLSSLPNDKGALKRLAEMGGFGPEEIQNRKVEWTKTGYMIYGREVPYHWVCTNTRRLAPGVLLADGLTPFHRLAWQVNALECDLETGEALIERCPRCCASLTWNNIEFVAVCGVCEFDAREQRPKYVSNSRLESARELNMFLHRTNPGLPIPFRQVDDITACLAMEWFGCLADLPTTKRVGPRCYNAAAGLAAVRSWPQSFDDRLRDCQANCSVTSGADRAVKCRLMQLLIGAIERAATPILRDILLERATRILGGPSIGR